MKFYFTYENPQENEEDENNEKDKVITVKRRFPGLQIVAEKTHNQFVTKLKNFNYYQIDLKKLLEVLKKKFDTTGSVREAGTEIMLQGTFLDQCKDYVTLELNFKEEQIEIIDKISKKKKKETFMT